MVNFRRARIIPKFGLITVPFQGQKGSQPLKHTRSDFEYGTPTDFVTYDWRSGNRLFI